MIFRNSIIKRLVIVTSKIKSLSLIDTTIDTLVIVNSEVDFFYVNGEVFMELAYVRSNLALRFYLGIQA